MPQILSVATATPPHSISQDEARSFAAVHFHNSRRDVERLLPVFENSGIARRYLCMPPEWFRTPHDFAEKNAHYIEWSRRLGREAAADCLTRAGLAAADITQIIFVSTTGLATPSIDAHLANDLGLSSHVVRTPLWGLGCGGGAAGLSHAYRAAQADPHALVLLVSVELCSLTFLHDDYSKSNLVATALFADGAAGVLVAGDAAGSGNGHHREPRPSAILGSRSTTWPSSLDIMGWNFDRAGMQVVFSRAIPGIVAEKVHGEITSFLAGFELDLADVRHWIAHPGGAKVIQAYQDALGLSEDCLAHARAVLRDYGNMSSPSVLFVLERVLANGDAAPGDYGLLTALGPGFSSESLLLQF